MNRRLAILCALAVACAIGAESKGPAKSIASLIDPSKLATPRERGANPRLQKAVALLETARQNKHSVKTVAGEAVKLAGYRGTLATLTRDSLTRNHSIADKLGVLNPAGLAEMRREQAPTIQRGLCKGDEFSMDYIVPRAVARA